MLGYAMTSLFVLHRPSLDTLPCPALHCLTLPCLALPYLALPSLLFHSFLFSFPFHSLLFSSFLLSPFLLSPVISFFVFSSIFFSQRLFELLCILYSLLRILKHGNTVISLTFYDACNAASNFALSAGLIVATADFRVADEVCSEANSLNCSLSCEANAAARLLVTYACNAFLFFSSSIQHTTALSSSHSSALPVVSMNHAPRASKILFLHPTTGAP